MSKALSVIAVGVALSGSGCASHALDNQRLLGELEHARQSAAATERRIAELEQRLQLLVLEQANAQAPRAHDFARVLEKLDLVIAQNEQLRMEVLSDQPPAAVDEPVAALLLEPSIDPAVMSDELGALDPEVQLRFWAERLRSERSHFRGGLSPEQNEALNILLRGTRSLDPINPWHDL